MAANGASRNRERVDSCLHQVERSDVLHVEAGDAGPSFCETA
jgi:hypothetical protein